MRATIDRIDEDPLIGYRLSNLAVLSHGKNSSKALSKVCYVFEIDFDNSFNYETKKNYRKFNNRADALNFVGVKHQSNTGRLYEVNGKHYLIQSEAVTLGLEEMAEHEYEDLEEYTAYVPVGILECSDGERRVLRQQIRFPYMKVVLKEATQ
jgi:hypothetical protein